MRNYRTGEDELRTSLEYRVSPIPSPPLATSHPPSKTCSSPSQCPAHIAAPVKGIQENTVPSTACPAQCAQKEDDTRKVTLACFVH